MIIKKRYLTLVPILIAFSFGRGDANAAGLPEGFSMTDGVAALLHF